MRRVNSSRQQDFDLNSLKKKNNKRKNKTAKIIVVVISVVLVLLIGTGTGAWIYINNILNHADRDELSSDVTIPSEAQKLYKDEDYMNIALFGLDTRSNDDNGRSDAMIILTLDFKHDKIKMSSIARDTYVAVKGHGHTKLTHAWAYGKANLAVDTINTNFNLDITDYVAVNFYQFSAVIDYIGGVDIDVDAGEMKVMNNKYVPYIKKMGIKCEKITKTGMQTLSGGQALAYARNRYTSTNGGSGSDVDRGSRQREVMMAMYEKAKKISITKLPKLASMILSECKTTLDNNQMISIATWAMTNSPKIENIGLPDEDCKAVGKTINGTWYYVYDLDVAAEKIHDFITETGEYAYTTSSEDNSSGSSKP